MNITYPNGTVLSATVLANDENEIRAIADGYSDVLIFTSIHGFWISEKLDPVALEFAWRHAPVPLMPRVDDCVCPAELAGCLIQTLFDGDEYSTNAILGRVAIRQAELLSSCM